MPTGSSPTFSTGTYSDGSVADDAGVNPIGPGAYNDDWTVLPAIANDFSPYESHGFVADSLFENFINADNGYN